MRILFDIEGNGLLDVLDTCHVIACMDIDTKELTTFIKEDCYKALELLDKADELIGHNIVDYDMPALKLLFNWQPRPEVKLTDTLVLAKLAHQDVRNEDFREKFPKLSAGQYGSHSLRAWGERLGEKKGSYEGDFKEYSQDMFDYCVQDVKSNEVLYQYLMKAPLSEVSVDIETKAVACARRMEDYGFAFDERAAGALYAELSAKREEIFKNLTSIFPTRTIERVSEKTGKPLKPQIIEFNPGSRDHIAYWFKEKYNWKPKDFTAGGKPEINEEILEAMEYPEAAQLKEYFMLDKRIGMLAEGGNAWLKLVKKDGRLHGRINTNGAGTGRCTHSNPNMAQVPSVRKEYGKECRSLFTVPSGYKLVGTDLSGIELRCLAHYLAAYDGGEYGDEIIKGDIHTRNQVAAGLPTRDAAKTFIYALLYGAGSAKMGTIIGGGKKEGEAIKKKFLTALPAFQTLSTKVAKAAERGYMVALDGRHLPVRSPHGAINSLLQGAAAIIAKKWMILTEENCIKAGLRNGKDFWLCTFVHDELQISALEKHAELVSKICAQSATQAGEELGMKCRVDAESKIGNNWYETH